MFSFICNGQEVNVFQTSLVIIIKTLGINQFVELFFKCWHWMQWAFDSFVERSYWVHADPHFLSWSVRLANTYVLGIIDGTYVGMCEDTGTI